MSTTATIPVLVAGAGPAGLVLALALAQCGVPVRIVDKEPFHRPGQRGSGIQPRTLEIFNYLGVLDDIHARGIRVGLRRVYKLPGGIEPLKTFEMTPYDPPTPSTPISNGVHLGQETSEAILRAHLAQYGVSVELGMEVRTFEQHSDYVDVHVAAKHASGEGETIKTIRCEHLVGCDGGRGVVRRQLGLSFLGETREEHIVVGEIEVFGLGRDCWHQWGDFSTKYCVLRPTETPEGFYFILAGHVDHAKVAGDRDLLIQEIYAATDRKDLTFGELRWISDWRPNIRMVDNFGKGRVFVAGDSAHIHSPTGGQGLNSSVQDAFNLAWKLALVHKVYAAPSLLATYTSERLPVIAAMLQKSTVLLDKARRAEDGAWARGGALKMLGVNYRWSGIVVDERAPDKPREPENVYGGASGGELRAGDRAPDAPGLVLVVDARGEDGATELFKIFGPTHHTVLLFTPEATMALLLLEELGRYPADSLKTVVVYPHGATDVCAVQGASLTVVDEQGHAFAGYGVQPECPTIVIIRPDGVVGGIVFGLDGLKKYLKGVFSAI